MKKLALFALLPCLNAFADDATRWGFLNREGGNGNIPLCIPLQLAERWARQPMPLPEVVARLGESGASVEQRTTSLPQIGPAAFTFVFLGTRAPLLREADCDRLNISSGMTQTAARALWQAQ